MPGKQITMQDGLSTIAATIGAMMLAPDADEEFLTDLLTVITAKVKSPGQPGMQSPAGPSPSGGGAPSGVAGPPQGAPPNSGPPPGAGIPGGGPPPPGQNQLPTGGQPAPGQGVMAKPGMPNTDELRRLLTSRNG